MLIGKFFIALNFIRKRSWFFSVKFQACAHTPSWLRGWSINTTVSTCHCLVSHLDEHLVQEGPLPLYGFLNSSRIGPIWIKTLIGSVKQIICFYIWNGTMTQPTFSLRLVNCLKHGGTVSLLHCCRIKPSISVTLLRHFFSFLWLHEPLTAMHLNAVGIVRRYRVFRPFRYTSKLQVID